MSSKNLKRIKGLRSLNDCIQENGQPVSKSLLPNMIPFGTQGFLIDMLSQLDLEEELKIGGNHWIEIQQSQTGFQTIIKEWYFKDTIPNNITLDSLLNSDNECTYSLITSINEEHLDSFIGVDDENILGQTINIPIVVQDSSSIPIDIINIQLYKGDCNQRQNVPIWSKNITINNNQGLTDHIVESLAQGEKKEGESE